MAGNLKVITDHGHFQTEMNNAGSKLVVVDFTASWCGPCQRIAPKFQEIAMKYPRALFFKVDIDECQDTASTYSVTSTPTFIFFRGKVKIDRVQGADPVTLENKVKSQYEQDSGQEDNIVAGHMDLSPFLQSSECECLNESDDHPLAHCLKSGGGYLMSDCDEQLIIALTFNQNVKLHSICVKAPQELGPKNIRLFINLPKTIDFDNATSLKALQEIEVKPEDLDGTPINLFYVKFQNVMSIQLFVKDNQGGGEITQIDHLALIGSPVSTTNMTDFKRVAGKAGESH